MQHQDISVAEFVSVLIFIAEECGKIIRQVQETGFKALNKDDKSPVTVADLRVQKTIEVCLKALYPSLRVEGEESKESIADIEPCIEADQITDEVRQFIK
jgi:3'-phosphoadenosine 5'-phosphosulfate (PAPS) 3'-phosphatase